MSIYDNDSGLIEVSAFFVEEEATKKIKEIDELRKKRDDQLINATIERYKRGRIFGLLPGKVISRQEAIKKLDDAYYREGWKSTAYHSTRKQLKLLLDMCNIKQRVHEITIQKNIYISGKQAAVLSFEIKRE